MQTASSFESLRTNFYQENSEGSYTYNPLKKPADLQLAQKHGKAKRIFKIEKSRLSGPICPCCGYLIDGGTPISLCIDLNELYPLGSGYALYFQFQKLAIKMLVMIFVLSGIYGIWLNVTSNGCSTSPTVTGGLCIDNLIGIFSIANARDDIDGLSTQLLLNLITLFLMIIFCYYIKYILRKKLEENNLKILTAANYTILVEGLSTDKEDPKSTSKEIIKWIESQSTHERPLKVAKISRAYNIHTYVRTIRKIDKIKHQIETSVDLDKNKTLLEMKLDLEEQLKIIKMRGFQLTDKAFITMDTMDMASYLVSKFSMSRVMHHINKFKTNRKIEISKAPEPSDINWENFGQNPIAKFLKRFMFSVLGLGSGALCIYLIVQINSRQYSLVSSEGSFSFQVQFLNMIASLIAAGVNLVFGILVTFLGEKSRFSSKTNLISFAAMERAVFNLTNLTFAVAVARIYFSPESQETGNIYEDADIYGPFGLVDSMFYSLIINAISNMIVTLICPELLIKKILRRINIWKGVNNKLSQEEANQLFEGADFELDFRYGYLMSAFAMQAFYAPALPLTIPITILGLTGNYWAEKYTFLRRIALPPSLGSKVQDEMSDFFEWIPFFYISGNLFFFWTLTDSNKVSEFDRINKIYTIGSMVGVILFWFVPFKKIVRLLIPKKLDPRKRLKYNEVKQEFTTDYERENPLTKRKCLRLLTLEQGTNVKDQEIAENPNELDIDFRRHSVINSIEEEFDNEDMEEVEVYAKNCTPSVLGEEIVESILGLPDKILWSGRGSETEMSVFPSKNEEQYF